MNNGNEPALDLLEAYLKHGANLTDLQRERWGADYPLTVLDEAMKRLAPRLSANSVREFADQYPKKTKRKHAVEAVLSDIGLKSLTFPQLRDKTNDILSAKYGIPDNSPASTASTGAPSTGSTAAGGGSSSTSGGSTGAKSAAASTKPKKKATASDDPQSVIQLLKKFGPVGNRREKLVTLLGEARKLKLIHHPHSFCFLLRSMFEISAKAYCDDHSKTGGPSAQKPNGDDRHLADLLRLITNHLTKNGTDKNMVKMLHGAMAELGNPNGFLSVTSMNQLVHNPRFSVKDTHISTLFFNVFPLLEAMSS